MAGKSNGKNKAYCGCAVVVSKDYGSKQTTSRNYQSQQGGQSSYSRTTKTSYADKRTGGYARASHKEVVSTGDTFKERGSGRVGYKDEYKTTSTYRVGHKGGYAEYQVEERFRRVNYTGSRSNKGNYSGRWNNLYLEYK